MTKYRYEYNRSLIIRSNSNKKRSTEAEKTLWRHLRNRTFEYKFRRQHPINNYILDFYCIEKKLAIELDGGQHVQNKAYDNKRTSQLEKLGIKVLRFWDSEVLKETNTVLEKILFELERLS